MEKWKKIKEFIMNKKSKDGKLSEKSQVFNCILSLYAGDDVEDVFSELAILYERYP